jgi:hypothetical protein
MQVPAPSVLGAGLVEPKELEVLISVHLEDVVIVSCLDADDVALLDVPLAARVQDLRLAPTDQVQLVEVVVVAVVLSALIG